MVLHVARRPESGKGPYDRRLFPLPMFPMPMFTSWNTLGALDGGATDSLDTGRFSGPTTISWTSDPACNLQ